MDEKTPEPKPANMINKYREGTLCGPTRELDGSILTFLNEEEGLACTACGTRRDEFPSRACGVLVRETDKEFRIGCYPIPQLCLDDYHLRHTNGFGLDGRSNEFGPPGGLHTPALVSEGERSSEVSAENESSDEELRDFTRKTPKVHGFERPSGNENENGSITASRIGHGSIMTNLFRSMKFSSDNFTVLSVPIEDSHPRGTETDLQDITATGTVDPEQSRESVKMTLPMSAKTFSPLLSNNQWTPGSTMKPIATNAPREGQGEREFLSDLSDGIKESKEILVEKRRDHHFFGTTTTTSTIPPTTTPRNCAVSGQLPANVKRTHSGCVLNVRKHVEHAIARRRHRTRPFTPPLNGFRRTQSTPVRRTTPTTTTIKQRYRDPSFIGHVWKNTGIRCMYLSCENNHKLCNFWAATGECDVNPNYMVPYCPLACLIC
ncbi:shTK domain protein [Teladorsagia circumcincta]|uniref:ShTK domain protein n=1 Tax=Teladorsagia circumcincta TaxID=45464 RepID=A0A2G9UWH3_TELCI|nr:shTK domain protein [Teladorsagia circumcincta]